jgi:hypothetical protein
MNCRTPDTDAMVIVDVALSVVSSPDFSNFIANLEKTTDTKITVLLDVSEVSAGPN